MPIQLPPLFPKRPDLFGGKRPPALPTWSVAGQVIDSFDHGVPGVLIRFINKETNVETATTQTDVNGKFMGKVFTNDAGYRVSPYKYLYAICPAYYDVKGNSEVIRFNCISIASKDENPPQK